jgi:hypothetical protein
MVSITSYVFLSHNHARKQITYHNPISCIMFDVSQRAGVLATAKSNKRQVRKFAEFE